MHEVQTEKICYKMKFMNATELKSKQINEKQQ